MAKQTTPNPSEGIGFMFLRFAIGLLSVFIKPEVIFATLVGLLFQARMPVRAHGVVSYVGSNMIVLNIVFWVAIIAFALSVARAMGGGGGLLTSLQVALRKLFEVIKTVWGLIAAEWSAAKPKKPAPPAE